MDIQDPLFEGKTIRLASIDHEKDAEIESKWTHNSDYLRKVEASPLRPLTPAQVRKKYEAIEKEENESKSLFYFTIRMREDDRLIGHARLYWLDWTNGNANIKIAIGDPTDQGKGYEKEALALLLAYAFSELNLHRLSTIVAEYDRQTLEIYQSAGFTVEVCRRQAQNRDGRRWDVILLGILASEWEQKQRSIQL